MQKIFYIVIEVVGVTKKWKHGREEVNNNNKENIYC